MVTVTQTYLDEKQHIDQELRDLALDYHRLNEEKNKADRQAKKRRKELYEKMKDRNISQFSFQTNIEGRMKTLYVGITRPVRNIVDVFKLYKMVPYDTFMKCISATQKAIVEHCGTAIANKVSSQGEGNEDVTVSLKK